MTLKLAGLPTHVLQPVPRVTATPGAVPPCVGPLGAGAAGPGVLGLTPGAHGRLCGDPGAVPGKRRHWQVTVSSAHATSCRSRILRPSSATELQKRLCPRRVRRRPRSPPGWRGRPGVCGEAPRAQSSRGLDEQPLPCRRRGRQSGSSLRGADVLGASECGRLAVPVWAATSGRGLASACSVSAVRPRSRGRASDRVGAPHS